MAIETQIRKVLKQHGFSIAAEMMEFHRFSHFALKRMLASWKDYPTCMNKYPTHLLVKRTYTPDM